nr:MAG TPA: hypothetical protein [Caudoviricetes sp.]
MLLVGRLEHLLTAGGFFFHPRKVWLLVILLSFLLVH